MVLTPAIKALTEFTKYTGKRKEQLEYLVYTHYTKKLIELQSHPQSRYAISRMTVMGLVGEEAVNERNYIIVFIS